MDDDLRQAAIKLHQQAEELCDDVRSGFTPRPRRTGWKVALMVVSVLIAYAILWCGCWLMRGNW